MVFFCRYVPSQADNVVYAAVGKAPAASLAHALRWYNQMTSWQSQKDRLDFGTACIFPFFLC